MTAVVAVGALLALAGVLGWILVHGGARPVTPGPSPLLGRRAVANLADGSVWIGDIGDLEAGFLVLDKVERVDLRDGSRTFVDGRVMIARRHLVTVQLP